MAILIGPIHKISFGERAFIANLDITECRLRQPKNDLVKVTLNGNLSSRATLKSSLLKEAGKNGLRRITPLREISSGDHDGCIAISFHTRLVCDSPVRHNSDLDLQLLHRYCSQSGSCPFSSYSP